jgi:uncharacterized membrane protein
MILGRSTPQWLSLLTAAGGLAQLLIVTMVPNVDATLVATIIGAIITFLGTFLAFLANTATTPTADPQLKAGTMVRVTDEAGTVVGHEPVPLPGETETTGLARG